MFRNVVALNAREHAGLRIRQQGGFAYAAGLHMAALTQAEFVRASALYPVLFVEDSDTDAFRPVALLGLKAGENVFVGPDGRWRASYVPASVRAYPFALARASGSDRLAVCIDAASTMISLSEGNPLFEADGQPAVALREAQAFLGQLRDMQRDTEAFCRALAERNLYTPLTVRVRRGDELIEVDGCYVVNEERLDGLPDARVFELRQGGWLAAVYAHLVSLMQIERLEAGPLFAEAPREPAMLDGA